MLHRLTRLLAPLIGRGAALRRPVVEEMEPRILYSADANPLLWAGLDPAATAIVASVETGEDAAAAVQTTDMQQQRRREIVFVDAAVDDAQTLIDDILAQRGDEVDVEIVQLRADADGLAQIGAVLAGEQGIDALHIVSHGGPGAVQLGNRWVDTLALAHAGSSFDAWRQALSPDADLLLYGCNVGEGQTGRSFVVALAELTGADVAASDDATGNATPAADWVLESSSGRIESSTLIDAGSAQAWSGVLAISANGTATSASTNGATSLTWSHTVGSGSDRALFVTLAIDGLGATSSGVTYGGQAMTLVGRTTGNHAAEIWVLKSPPVGTANVVASFWGTTAAAGGAVTYNGVNQTTATGTYAGANGGGTSASVDVASAVGEMVIDVQNWTGSAGGYAVGANQSLVWSAANTTNSGRSSTEAGAALVTMSSTVSSWAQFEIGAVSIKAAASAVPGITVSQSSGLGTTEAGGTAQFTVVLDSAPTGDVTIAVSSSDTSEATLSTSLLTFTTANWNVAQTVTVTGVNDALADGFQPYSIVLGAASSSDGNYNALNPADVQGATSDNDITVGQIAVTTASDSADGDTSSLAALAANRGADGLISLREAIIAANNTANGTGADRITFDIAGTGVHTINLQSLLPTITGAVVIDASSDDSFAANGSQPAVVLSGDANSEGSGDIATGLTISGTSANGSTVRGLIFQRFTSEALLITGSDGNTIAGNWFGLTSNGSAAAGNTVGITLWNASNNLIGGSTAADRNVVSASTNVGIGISTNNGSSTGNLIRGNYIGTDATGAAGIGNANQGIWVSAAGNTIGGTTAGQGNVISGTVNWVGVQLEAAASGTLIAGNLIGLNAAGTAALGNAGGGVYIESANNTVGGTTVAARNVISGNVGAGLMLMGATATGNVVIGNYIGTDAAGTGDVNGSALVGGASGVVMDFGASNNRIGTDADGSNDAAERNVVSGNNWYGIEFLGAGTSGNVAQGNYVGVDATGLVALGNAQGGVSFWNGASNNRLGGGASGAGNLISANGTGVQLANGVSGNKVQGNLIGLGADGTTALGNVGAGVYFYNGGSASLVTGNVIGTDADGSNDAGERNVISANDRGVSMLDAEVTGNVVAGNYIGTDATGLLDRGNTVHGVSLLNAAHANTIGGSLAAQRNVISGNDGTGIEVNGEASDANILRGNWIGVAASGAASLGNGGHGIFISDGGDNTLVGGTGANDGNWIASPGLGGIFVKGDSTGTVIQGNRIGTDLAGTANWGSGQIGILLENGASQTLVGGTTASAGNAVAFSGQGGAFTAGIAVIDATSSGNVLLRNSVYSSVGMGIDLGNDGVTANDVGDTDSGANNLLNALTLDAAVTDSSTLYVAGGYVGAPNTYYRIDVYSNTSAEPLGSGEGRTWVGTVNMPVGASGSLSGSYSFSGAVAAGSYISATVTRTDSSYTTLYETSEFSNHVVATAPTVAPTGSNGTISAVEDTVYTFTTADFGFADSDGDSLQRVWIDTLPATGTFRLNGSTFDAGTGLSALDIALGRLTYTAATDANGAPLASFTFRVQDDGGTLGGGADTDASANTLTINVTAVNDAPSDLYTVTGVAGSSLIGAYTFGSPGELGRDDAGDDAPITFVGTPTQTAGPTGSAALELSGGASGPYGNIAGITTGGAMTIAAQVRFDSTAAWQRVVDFGQDASTGIAAIYIGRFNATNDLTFTIEQDTGGVVTSYRATAIGAITNGSWMHVAATVDGSGTMSLYINGALTASTTGMVPELGVRTHNYIGKSNWGGDALFDGAIDNLVIANGAMTASQVAALQSQGNAFTVPENAANGTVLGTVVVSDADASDTFTISLSDSAGGRFAVAADGTLTVANGALLDYETSTSHSFTVLVTDTGGATRSETFTVTLADINEAPLATITGSSLAYTENAAATVVDGALTLSDADSATLTGATVTIAANHVSGQDVLSFTDQNGISGSWNAGTGVLTLSGSASLANYQAALRSITYANTSDAPSGATRTVSIVVSDGAASSTAATRDIVLSPVNDAPLNSVPAGLQSTAVNTALVLSTANGKALTVSDFDATTLQVTLTATHGTLTLQATAGLSFGSGDGSADATMVFTGTTSAINAALDGLRYTPTAAYQGSATLTVTTSDLGATGSGGTQTDSDTVMVQVGATVFQQGVDGYTGTEDTWVSTSSPGTNHGAETTVISDDDSATDAALLRFANLFGSGAGQIPAGATITGVTLSIYVTDGDSLDTIALHRMFGAWTEASTYTSLGSGVQANGSEAGGSALLSLDAGITGWNNLSSASLTAAVQAWANGETNNGFAFISGDADNWTFASSEHGTVSLRPYMTVAFTPPQAPAVVASGGGVTYTEGAAAVAIDAGLTLSDADSTVLTGATVRVATNYASGQDVLAFSNQSGISGNWNAGTGVLTLSGSASLADYQAALRTVTFVNSSDAPSTAARSIEFTVSDAQASSSAASRTLLVGAVNDAPVITSHGGAASAAVSFSENQTAVATVTLSDVDGGTAVYSITGGADAARFAIDASTGVLTFNSAPDYESPADTGADNVYDVTVQVSDGAGGSDTQAIAVTVTPVNDNAPVIGSNGGGATAAVGVAENQTVVTTVVATDADLPAQTITYTIVGGADAARFTIDASSGALSFVSAPDFEGAADVGANNVYDVIVQASDGAGSTDTQAIAVTVMAVNDNAPVIASNGGGATAAVNVAENQTAVTTVSATDADAPPQTIVYSIVGGADVARFTIDAGSGALAFVGAPDFETPADAGADNVYDVIVQASDGAGGTDTQSIAVTVTPVNDNAPVIGSDGGGASAAVGVAENQTAVTTVSASDADLPVQTLGYSISGGADAALFSIDAVTGVLVFNSAPDFEAPGDADGDNVYHVVVQVSDGSGGSDSQAIAVTVGNVNEAPVITSATAVSAAENQTTVVTVTSGDVDGAAPVYAIAGGADAALFTIHGTTGALSFIAAPDAEAPADADGDNVYEVTVQVSDGNGGSASQAVAVTVSNVNEAPVITSADAVSVAENQTTVLTVTSSDVDGGAAVYAIVGGADAALFSIDAATGALVFNAAPDVESPGDADGDNVYAVTVQVSDGNGATDTLAIAVTVSNVNEAPVITSASSASAAENQTAVQTVTSSDVDGSAATYAIVGGADAGHFSVDTATGALSFGAAPDFEAPADADGDNVYDVIVQVSDGNGGSATQAIALSITNVNEAPVITSAAVVSVAENQTAVTTVTSSDADGGAAVYTITGGADAARFTIDATTGVLSLNAAPDHETPDDADGDNVYDVTVQVSDGNGGTATQAIAVTVTNVNEAPAVTSGASVNAAENQTVVTTVTSSDVDGGAPVYAIGGGADASLFSIDGATGVLSFVAAPDFEASADADGDNVYEVSVQVSDGAGGSTAQAIAVTVTNVNEAPVVTSSAIVAAAENQTAAATVTSSDVDGGAAGYTIVGGADASLFAVDATTGTLTFAAAPDHEAPADADGDNVYEVTVQVADGNGSTATQTISVSVTNVNEAPVITSAAAVSATENQTAVQTVSSSDVDGGAAVYTIVGGADAALFSIDPSTGVLAFQAAPDFEAPSDADGDNAYELTVQVSDGNGASVTQALTVHVGNVNEAPRFTSHGGSAQAAISLAENSLAVTTLTSSDVDGPGAAYAVAGGADAARFAVDAASGALRFVTAPDHETATDADRDNVYELTVMVSDGQGGSAVQSLAVWVEGMAEAPWMAMTPVPTLAENAPAGTVVATVSAGDPDAGDLLSFTLLSDGQGNFVIDAASGQVRVAPGATLDFETAPSQTLYLRVTDASGLSTEQSIVVTLGDVADTVAMPVVPEVTPPPTPPAPSVLPADPAPAPPPTAAATPLAGGSELEEVGGRDDDATSTGASHSPRSLVGAARAGDAASESDATSLAQRPRATLDGSPLLMASVSFSLDGAKVSDFSEDTLDRLLARAQGDLGLQRLNLLGLRPGSLDVGDDDAARAAADDPARAIATLLQDPVRVASATLTAGFVWWLTRSGGLLTSILMGIPAWRHVDLLPVLAPRAEDDGLASSADDTDDESRDGGSDSRHDSGIEALFSNTSRLPGDSRYR